MQTLTGDFRAGWRRMMMFAVGAFVLVGVARTGMAQSDPPTETNSGARPYVVVIMDTSTSMQWTDDGPQQYPRRNYSPTGVEGDPYPNQPSMWRTDLPLGVDEGGDGTFNYNSSSNPLMFGSCVVWEPSCDQYERPSWNPNASWTGAYSTGSAMGGRLSQFIRGEKSIYSNNPPPVGNTSEITGFPLRLSNISQPRHVTFKEILSGSMILRPTDVDVGDADSLNPNVYGPGCWFVPRQRNLSGRQDRFGVCKDTSGSSFDRFPDYQAPRPHLQEVWDTQEPNGLMDSMNDQIIFSAAMFDSYRSPVEATEPDWSFTWNPLGIEDPYTGSLHGFDEDTQQYYNYGVYKVVGPNTLDIPTSYLPDVSSFVQTALVDGGTLKQGADTSSSYQLDPAQAPSQVSVTFSSGLDSYMDTYSLSRQPMAGETPLAGAMYDIQQYFNQPDGPVREDPFKQCRPKHVVMMTDGLPLPERNPQSGQRCEPVDQTGLRAGFGLDPDKYGYQCTEEHIRRFVQGDGGGGYMVQGGAYNQTYDPRVHVVGLSLQGEQSTDSAEKLASMARAGKTCAGYYLKQEDPDDNPATQSPWIPEDDGECPRDDHPCLVQQYDSNAPSFVPYEKGASAVECKYPALVLQCNGTAGSFSTEQRRNDFNTCQSSKWFADAFQRVFNQILSSTGIASRNKAAIVENLDDEDLGQGQYRLLSGVRVDGAKTYWKGLMYRETRLCSQASVDPYQDGSFHDQIADQVTGQETDNPQTNRRVFTMMPSSNIFDFSTQNVSVSQVASNDVGYFLSTYKPRSIDIDEFGSSYMARSGGSGTGNPVVVGTRIPFEATTLLSALTEDTGFDSAPFADAATALSSYFGVSSVEEFRTEINEIRGRVQQRADRVLGGIVNSTPETVGPPDAELPVDSYEAFQELYADRPSMAYVSTVDGMLHAIHTGRLNQGVMVRDHRAADNPGARSASQGDAIEQREAWAYIPQALQDDFTQVQGNVNILNGSPVVQDVRLCHPNNEYNQNFQACRSVCSDDESLGSLGSGTTCVDEAQRWRTVLVQSFGDSERASGYFALDVTRPGGQHTRADGTDSMQVPDPIPLWEFTPSWEEGQVKGMFDLNTGLPRTLVEPEHVDVNSSSGPLSSVIANDSTCSDTLNTGTTAEYIWKKPLLGRATGKPAIGSVVMQAEPSNGSDVDRIRRPIAVFAGGEQATDSSGCARSGKAIYVVDLQTGSLLRRFTEYQTETGWEPFQSSMVGTPALYDSSPGGLVTRGYVGDKRGRMFRIDFTSSNPDNWQVQLFFDPMENTNVGFDTADDIGGAYMQPALGLGQDDNLVVIYGLGNPAQTKGGGKEHAIFALQESNAAIRGATSPSSDFSELLWFVKGGDGMPDGAKLTGEPVIFNSGVYFTTYYTQASDICEPGKSRIYGIQYDAGIYDSDSLNGKVPTEAVGMFDCASQALQSAATCDSRYFEPQGQTLIAGLTIASGPACGLTGNYDDGSAKLSGPASGGDSGQPQLIAQTGGVDPGGDLEGGPVAGGSAAGGNALHKIEVGLDDTGSVAIPLSWTTIAR